jgi:DNA-directed RNA polymerase specialized sigma24 family protein
VRAGNGNQGEDKAMKKKDILANGYEGVVEKWKVELVRARLRRFRVPRHDRPDIEQEIVLALMRFQFDAAKADGATEAAVLRIVIDRRIITFLRRAERRRRFEQAREDQSDPDSQNGDDEPAVCDDTDPLVLDVQQTLATLPPTERAVCTALSLARIFHHFFAVSNGARAFLLV